MNTSKRFSIILLLFWSFSQLPAQNIITDVKSYHDSGAPLEIREYEETEKLVELSRTVQSVSYTHLTLPTICSV